MDFSNFLIALYLVLNLLLIFWAWYDIFGNEKLKPEQKTIFALLVVLLPFLGPIIYFHLKRTQNRKRMFLASKKKPPNRTLRGFFAS